MPKNFVNTTKQLLNEGIPADEEQDVLVGREEVMRSVMGGLADVAQALQALSTEDQAFFEHCELAATLEHVQAALQGAKECFTYITSTAA